MADVYVTTTGNDTTGDGSSGNPYASPGKAAGVMAGGDRMLVKTGTYTISSTTANIAGGKVSLPAGVSATSWTRMEAYKTTAGDLGAGDQAILQVASSGVTSITVVTQAGNYCRYVGIKVDGQSKTSIRGFSSATAYSEFYRCTATLCTNHGFSWSNAQAVECLVLSCGNSSAFASTVSYSTLYSCVVQDSGLLSCSAGTVLVNCIIDTSSVNAGEGAIWITGHDCFFSNVVVYGTTGGSGFNWQGYKGIAVNCIMSNCAQYGMAASSTNSVVLISCAGYSNTSGNVDSDIADNYGFVSLSGSPFTNAAGGDFSLNNTAGAGAACRAAGIPGAFPGGLTTGYLDIGAVQHQDSGSGGAIILSGLGQIGVGVS